MSKENKKTFSYLILVILVAVLLLVGHLLYSKSQKEGDTLSNLDLSKGQEVDSRAVQRFPKRDPKDLRFARTAFTLKNPLVVGKQSEFQIKFLTQNGKISHLYPLAGKLIFLLSPQAPKASLQSKGSSHSFDKHLVLSRKQLQYDKGILRGKLRFAKVKDSLTLTVKHREPGQRQAKKLLQTKLRVSYGPVRQLRFSTPAKTLQAGQKIRLMITALNYRGDTIKKWLPSQVPLRLDTSEAKAELNYSISANGDKTRKSKAQKRINLPGSHFSAGKIPVTLRPTQTGRYHLRILDRQAKSDASKGEQKSEVTNPEAKKTEKKQSFTLTVKPAALAQTKIKCQDSYPAGQKISLAWRQVDKFGNTITNPRLGFRITPDPGPALRLPSKQSKTTSAQDKGSSSSAGSGQSFQVSQNSPIIIERSGTYNLTTDKGSKKITIKPRKLDHWQITLPSQAKAGHNSLLKIEALDRYNNPIDKKQRILLQVNKKGLLPPVQKPQGQSNNQDSVAQSPKKSNRQSKAKGAVVMQEVGFTGTWKYMFQPQKSGRYKLRISHLQLRSGKDSQQNIDQKTIKISPNKPALVAFALSRQKLNAGQVLRLTPRVYDAYHNPISAKEYKQLQALITWQPLRGDIAQQNNKPSKGPGEPDRSTKGQSGSSLEPQLQLNGNKISFVPEQGGYAIKLKAGRPNRLRVRRSGHYQLKPHKLKLAQSPSRAQGAVDQSSQDSEPKDKDNNKDKISINSFRVEPAGADKLVIQSPAKVRAGNKINISIYAQDRFGNQTFWPKKLRLVGSKDIIKKEQQAFSLKSPKESLKKSPKDNTGNKKIEGRQKAKDYLPRHNVRLHLQKSGRYRLTVYGYRRPKTKRFVVEPADMKLTVSKARLAKSVFWLRLRLQDRFGNPPQQKKPLSLTASCPQHDHLAVYGRGVYDRSKEQKKSSFKINFYGGQKTRGIGLYCYKGQKLTLKQNGESLWQRDLAGLRIASPRARYLARQQSKESKPSFKVVAKDKKQIELKSDAPLTKGKKQLAALSFALSEYTDQQSYIITWQNKQKDKTGFIFYHKPLGRLDIQLWRRDEGQREWRKIWRKLSASNIRQAASNEDKSFPGKKEVYQ